MSYRSCQGWCLSPDAPMTLAPAGGGKDKQGASADVASPVRPIEARFRWAVGVEWRWFRGLAGLADTPSPRASRGRLGLSHRARHATWSVGSRARASCGGSGSRPRWIRISVMVAGSVTLATMCLRPPHGQARTSSR
jgi:hypothetical protein